MLLWGQGVHILWTHGQAVALVTRNNSSGKGKEIKKRVEQTTGETFNSVLCNRYRNGSDTVGWHADNESIYGPKPTIASVTLGAERDFDLREGKGGTGAGRLRIRLAHGSLLVMSGATQDRWQHSLPRRTTVKDERINLTFRRVV